ncbi:MAG: hypothetical protein AAFV86_19655, partial [Pseudomonadota bacterium]
MNRRTVLTASAALPAAALPALAMTNDADPSDRICPAAIRARVRQVVETYTVARVAFPNPMTADEAEAALAMTDAELQEPAVILPWAKRWGVCLDWLVMGRVSGLLIEGRAYRESEAQVRPTSNDPALTAYQAWREADRARHAYCDRGEDIPEAEQDIEFEALSALADTVATTPAGLAAQVRVSFELFGDLRRHGDAENPDDYFFDGWRDEEDGRMLRTILEGAERRMDHAAMRCPLLRPVQPPTRINRVGFFWRVAGAVL